MYGYTIDQIYLFYEKCKKIEMASDKMNAIILSQAMSYTAPVYKSSDAHRKQRVWSRFLDSLDWEKVMKKADRTVKKFMKDFRNLKIPIKKSKEESIKGGK